MVSLAALFPFISSISNVHRQVGWEKNERLPSHLFPAKNLPVGTLIRLDKQPVWFWNHDRGWRSVCKFKFVYIPNVLALPKRSLFDKMVSKMNFLTLSNFSYGIHSVTKWDVLFNPSHSDMSQNTPKSDHVWMAIGKCKAIPNTITIFII